MARVALPEMRKHKYSDALASGCLAAGGTLGILIPPSIVLIIYALLTEQNIVKLFLAATLPGLLAIVGFSELTLETRQAAASTRAYFTFFLAAGALYLIVTLCSGAVFARIEKWARRGQPSLKGAGR